MEALFFQRATYEGAMAKITPEMEAAIVADYQAGLGGTTIARKYSLCKRSVATVRVKHGVAARPLGERGRRYALNHAAFDEDTPEARYWVGALMTDGCIYGKPGAGAPKIILQVQAQDLEWVEQLRAFLGYTGPIGMSTKPGPGRERRGPYPRLAVASAQIAAALARYGVVPRKTATARPPDWLLRDPDFWRGCVDGDGHVRVDKDGTPRIGLTGRLLVDAFAGFVASVTGFRPTVYGCASSKGRWNTAEATSRIALAVVAHLYLRAGPALGRKRRAAGDMVTRFEGYRWRSSAH